MSLFNETRMLVLEFWYSTLDFLRKWVIDVVFPPVKSYRLIQFERQLVEAKHKVRIGRG